MRKIIALTMVACLALTAGAQSDGWSAGIQAGVTAHTTTGSLRDNFKGCVGFTGGITADHRNLRLKADVTYGQPSFKNYNMYDVRDDRGNDAQLNAVANATHVGASAQAGLTVARLGRVAVTPAAGVYMSRYSWRLNDIEWEKNEQGDDVFRVTATHSTAQSRVSWIASVDFDLLLHQTYTDILGGQRRLRSSLRVTPWLTRISHKTVVPGVSGMQVGVNVTYSGMLSAVGGK